MRLEGNRIAVLVANEFDDSELAEPVKALESAGAEVSLIGMNDAATQGVTGVNGLVVPADTSIDRVNADDFDALYIPGGRAPSLLRRDDRVLSLVRRINQAQKPIGAVGRGPQVLVSSQAGLHHRMTGYPRLSEEFDNIGAIYSDEPVVVDGNIVTSRGPQDMQLFLTTFFEMIQKKERETAA